MSRAPVWIFDLDDTLHHASPEVFARINRAMTAYLQVELAVSEAEANHLRVAYWQRYGATLNGMMRHHATDPQHFLRETHPVAELTPVVRAKAGLRTVLRRLPGRKVLFTNGPAHYAEAILKALGVRWQFAAVIAIEQGDYLPKPQAHPYRCLLRRLRLPAARCIMVDDALENVQTAQRLGMRAFWFGARHRPNHSLRRVRHLPELLRWRRLKP